MEAYFPTYKSEFTKTPNIFFKEILPKAQLNESRLVGYLIRHTLGYNMDAPWTGISRKKIIEEAGVSNGQLTKTIQSCEEKGWILTYVEGDVGKEKRYYFLNDEINQRIVQGLESRCFTTNKLRGLNLFGIRELLDEHNLITPTATVEVLQPDGYGDRRGTATVEIPLQSPYGPPTTTVEVTPTVAVGVKVAQAQSQQGLAGSLKTIIKDNKEKDISKDNNNNLAVANDLDDLHLQNHIATLKVVVGEQVSEASIRTWLKHGSVDRVMKCWFKAQEKSNVDDLGAYVTSLLKMNADQDTRVSSARSTLNDDEEPVIMQMWKARQEVASTSEFEQTDESNQISNDSLDSNTDEAEKVWGNTLYILEQNMSKPQFTTWFDKPEVRVLDFKNNTLIVEVPNDFHRDWMENQFSIQIKNAVCAITGRETAIKFVLPLSNEHKRA